MTPLLDLDASSTNKSTRWLSTKWMVELPLRRRDQTLLSR